MKKIVFLAIIVLLFACNNEPQKQESQPEAKPEQSTKKVDESKIGRNNYATVWKWATDDKQLMEDNVVEISNEMMDLWKSDVVENAYYDSDAKIDKFEYFPNISFFVKTKTKEEAEAVLDKMTIVKEGIANYTIYAVGNKWLGRKAEAIRQKGLTKSFVAVWNTITAKDQTNAKQLVEENAQAQADAIMALWKNGDIENVYFDIEGTQQHNDVQGNRIKISNVLIWLINVDFDSSAFRNTKSKNAHTC